MSRWLLARLSILSVAVALVACGGDGGSSKTAEPVKVTKVGFIYSGLLNDEGWNAAMFLGESAVKKMPNVETVNATIVESSAAAAGIEGMIQQGATIIFATGSGFLIFDLAQKHPDIMFFEESPREPAANVGVFFAATAVWETEYLAGMAAGGATRTNRLGLVLFGPNPTALLAANAFHLGARSVNPNVTTFLAFTAICDQSRNVGAVQNLARNGIDVVNLYADCVGQALAAAETLGVMSIGYSIDNSRLAPKGWLTAMAFSWGNVFTNTVEQVVGGNYKSTLRRYSLKDGVVNLSPFGLSVAKSSQEQILAAKEKLIRGELSIFTGPVRDQAGTVRIAEGGKPDMTVYELQRIDWLAEGIIGNIPASPPRP